MTRQEAIEFLFKKKLLEGYDSRDRVADDLNDMTDEDLKQEIDRYNNM